MTTLDDLIAAGVDLSVAFLDDNFLGDDFRPKEHYPVDPLDNLARAQKNAVNAQNIVAMFVKRCRQANVSWRAIGEQLGISGEAARLRYTKKPKRAPKRSRAV